ncbi:BA14K family protein [Rhizobium terrae]|uniref:BA14K family protein n=1 Tax=Rhizobium terrae TaxID=2171756 RepID=UPI003857B1A0
MQSAAPISRDVAAAPREQMVPPDDAQPVREQPLPEEEPVYGAQADYANSEAVDNGVPVGAHEEWCFARYRSYRAEDNSYRPFEGGPRRTCRSPYG